MAETKGQGIMTPHELIIMLASKEGPCGRFCAWCPEDINTAEVKECVEKMYKEIYLLQQDKDNLLHDIIAINQAYRELTGSEYKFDKRN